MSIKSYIFSYVLLVSMADMQSAKDTVISIVNKTDNQLYAATYTSSGRRVGPVVTVPPAGETSLKPPASSFFKTSTYKVIGDMQADMLTDELGTVPSYRTSAIDNGKNQTVFLQTVGQEIGATAATRSETLSIRNTTQHTLYVALYYDNGKKAYRWGEAQVIAPDEEIKITRPERSCSKESAGICLQYFDRNVYISTTTEAPIAPVISSKSQPYFNVGSVTGKTYIIYTTESGAIKGAFDSEWQVRSAYTVASKLLKPDIDAVREKFDAMNYPGKGQVATIRTGSALSDQEVAFRRKRHDQYVRPQCEKLFTEKFKKKLSADAAFPTIALCVSGGGFRAMVLMAGFLAAAEEAGFLPYLTYIATLSGSTWGLAAWLKSGLSAVEYRNRLCKQLSSGIQFNFDILQVQEAVLRKTAYGQETSIIDVYGALLADKLLKPFAPHKDPNNIFWGAPQPAVDAAQVPYPIYTAVTPRQFTDLEVAIDPVNYYHWLIFDAYEVGITLTGDGQELHIPAWSLGRKFVNGRSVDMPPPLSMGYCMGIFGSAMSVNPRDATRLVIGSLAPELAADVVKLIAKNKTLDLLVQQRASPGKLFNFVKNGLMTLVDGGMSQIFPFPPVLRKARHVDVIISLDGSAGIKLAPGLRSAEHYVKLHEIPFPKLDLDTIGKNPYTVAWDKDSLTTPVLIHLPAINYKDYHNNWDLEKSLFAFTLNFIYSEENAETLSGLGAHMFGVARDAILQTIADWLEMHNTPVIASESDVVVP